MSVSLRNFAGREIILAGGSGGLGSEVAPILSKDGAKLIVSFCHIENKPRADALSPIATIIQADVTNVDDRKRLLDAAPNLYGLVVLTGIPARAPAGATTQKSLEKVWEESLSVNYTGSIQLAREAVARMREHGMPGSVVLMGTMQAEAVFSGATAYAGAKAALIHAGRILAKEARGKQEVRVNIISPGVTNAGMAKASVAANKYKMYLDAGLVSRYGRAEDIARAIRFFLEPDNYITGQHLVIDGGLNLSWVDPPPVPPPSGTPPS